MIDWTDIIVALIALCGTGLGTFYGIKKSNSLTLYRIDQLEKKVDTHNDVQNRVLILEEQLKEIRKSTEKLTDRTTAHGEQIDQAYTLAEKNEGRIQLLERLANK